MSAPTLTGVVAGPAVRSRLLGDAAALASSSLLTAGIGFLFWGVAARAIPPERLGTQTALLALITAPGVVLGSGIGDAFTALLPRAGHDRSNVLWAGYRLVLLLSVVLGAGAGLLAVTVLDEVRGSVLTAVIVALGVGVWALFIVQDSALTSLGRARWLPFENGAVSVAKLALVVALASLGNAVLLATLLPAAVAIGVLAPRVFAMATQRGLDVSTGSVTVSTDVARPISVPGADPTVGQLARQTTGSVAMTLGALTLLPFVVTAMAGPAQGAVFALCLAVVQSLDFVAAALGVSLVVHASSRPDEAGRMARQVLVRAAALVGLGGIALVLLAPTLLGLLRPAYLDLGGVRIIAILCLGSFGRTVFIIWSGLARSRRRMRPVLVLNAVTVVVLYLLVPVLAHRHGAVGAAVGLALAQAVLSAGAAGHVAWCRRSGRARGIRR